MYGFLSCSILHRSRTLLIIPKRFESIFVETFRSASCLQVRWESDYLFAPGRNLLLGSSARQSRKCSTRNSCRLHFEDCAARTGSRISNGADAVAFRAKSLEPNPSGHASLYNPHIEILYCQWRIRQSLETSHIRRTLEHEVAYAVCSTLRWPTFPHGPWPLRFSAHHPHYSLTRRPDHPK